MTYFNKLEKTMKHILIALALALAAFGAQADSSLKRATFGVEYGQSETTAGIKAQSLSHGANFWLNNGVTLEARNITSQGDGGAAAVSWQEFAAGYTQPVGPTNVYAKEFFNINERTGAQYYGHSEEFGIAGVLAQSPLTYIIGYRITNAFDNAAYHGHHIQWRYTAGWKLDDKHGVYLRYTKQDGDLSMKVYSAGYSYTF